MLLIYTGGTIGMKTDPVTGTLVPFDFNGIYDEFPSLRRLDVDLEVLPFEPIDSSNVAPELWVRLADIIRENYERYDGFVVLHGTDTMSYSSSALSFMLENLGKPVVFTGSQIPIGVLRTDGRENLITAIEIAAAKEEGRAIVPEVSLYFQNRLFRANRTKKHSAEELSAFASHNYPALADVGVGIHYRYGAICRCDAGKTFSVNTAVSQDVAVVKIFPGMTEPVFRAMLSAEGVRGVVLETYGAGNAPTFGWFIGALEEAISRGGTCAERDAVRERFGEYGYLRNRSAPAGGRRHQRPRHHDRGGACQNDVPARPRLRYGRVRGAHEALRPG